MADFDRDSMQEMFIYEMNQQLETLEKTIVQSEAEYNNEQINEIFRIMHTIKGSAAMMLVDNITNVAHVAEDLFFFLRDESPEGIDYPTLSDFILASIDFMNEELAKMQEGKPVDGDASHIIEGIKHFLATLKSKDDASDSGKANKAPAEDAPLRTFKARVTFDDGCEMENIRAYTLVHNLRDLTENIQHIPGNVVDTDAIDLIRKNGFLIEFTSRFTYDVLHAHLLKTVYLSSLSLEAVSEADSDRQTAEPPATLPETLIDPSPLLAPSVEKAAPQPKAAPAPGALSPEAAEDKKSVGPSSQNFISVGLNKLEALMKYMGELVIKQQMVTNNSEINALKNNPEVSKYVKLEDFEKQSRELKQIIGNLQETAMSMRLVPLTGTFTKQRRSVRDLCRQLDKEVDLEIIGEENEVDKTIADHIGDPIMHIIRNSIDHGIEMPEARIAAGKPPKGKVVLKAENSGGDVMITIKDDGAGLNRERILEKAEAKGFLTKARSDYTDKEVHQLIFKAGLSTKSEEVTAVSGRGVGMDAVVGNLEVINGSVTVESTPGVGTTFTLKIPLTLAIISGMQIKLADRNYTIPISAIKRSFVPQSKDVFTDPDGNEMITDHGEIFNVLRMYEFFGIEGAKTNIEDSILMQLQHNDEIICLMVDKLEGEQQAVLQPLPRYFGKINGISGCTLLGSGEICLIVDVAGFFEN